MVFHDVDSQSYIHDYSGLMEKIARHAAFQEGAVTRLADGVHDLTHKEITIRFYDAAYWSSALDLDHDPSSIDDSKVHIHMATGSEEELIAAEKKLERRKWHALGLPLSEQQMVYLLQNIFNLQTIVLHSEMIHSQVHDVNSYIRSVLTITQGLNSVRDSSRLLAMILEKARTISGADTGIIYTVVWEDNLSDRGRIYLQQMQSLSLPQQTAFGEGDILIDEHTALGRVVLDERSLAVIDPENGASQIAALLPVQYEALATDHGIVMRSLLLVPMFDIGNRVNGVIQLVHCDKRQGDEAADENASTPSAEVFTERDIDAVEIIARQGGIALENAFLTEERDKLFDGFVHAAVSAIEQRDPTTSGHSVRVAHLTVGTAGLLNKIVTGCFRDVNFTYDQLKELEYASLLHDFGKIGVREEVLVKAKKLYPWQQELIVERFNRAKSSVERDYLRTVIDYFEHPDKYPPWFNRDTLLRTSDDKIKEINRFLEFILKCNEPTVLEQGGFEMLREIASHSLENALGQKDALLTEPELKALSISRGSLTQQEFNEIQSHVNHTFRFLRKIPWGAKFSAIPQLAAKHHEKLDGSGYPNSCPQSDIPVQTRIMTIADIFDALTASDRPYKKAVPVDKALSIIEMEVKGGKCDADLFQIFVESRIYESVVQKTAR